MKTGIKCWITWLRLDCVWNPYHEWIYIEYDHLSSSERNESKVFWNELVNRGLALLNTSPDFAVPSHGIMSSPSFLSPRTVSFATIIDVINTTSNVIPAIVQFQLAIVQLCWSMNACLPLQSASKPIYIMSHFLGTSTELFA